MALRRGNESYKLALKQDVEKLMAQRKHIRLALPMAALTIQLFDGEIFYGNPTQKIEKLLEQAKREFPNKQP